MNYWGTSLPRTVTQSLLGGTWSAQSQKASWRNDQALRVTTAALRLVVGAPDFERRPWIAFLLRGRDRSINPRYPCRECIQQPATCPRQPVYRPPHSLLLPHCPRPSLLPWPPRQSWLLRRVSVAGSDRSIMCVGGCPSLCLWKWSAFFAAVCTTTVANHANCCEAVHYRKCFKIQGCGCACLIIIIYCIL